MGTDTMAEEVKRWDEKDRESDALLFHYSRVDYRLSSLKAENAALGTLRQCTLFEVAILNGQYFTFFVYGTQSQTVLVHHWNK